MRDESVNDYIRRFHDTKNRCFGVNIAEKDLAYLAFSGLHSHIKERLEGYDFFTVTQVHQRALAAESQSKESQESHKHHRPNMHALECNSNSSDNESKEVYTAEFARPSKDKSHACSTLMPIHKNQQEEKFNFNVSKSDRIFDQLYKNGYIKMSHMLPPLEEIKRRAFCKWHNSFSHAMNDCNVFRRQIQSAINEERLPLRAMQVDHNPFPVHTLELKNLKVLVRANQAETTKEKNIIVGEERSESLEKGEKASLKKTPKVSLKDSTLGGNNKAKLSVLHRPI
jgi:hypothetical protein